MLPVSTRLQPLRIVLSEGFLSNRDLFNRQRADQYLCLSALCCWLLQQCTPIDFPLKGYPMRCGRYLGRRHARRVAGDISTMPRAPHPPPSVRNVPSEPTTRSPLQVRASLVARAGALSFRQGHCSLGTNNTICRYNPNRGSVSDTDCSDCPLGTFGTADISEVPSGSTSNSLFQPN